MIQLNPKYEKIFEPRNIDDDCDKIAGLMSSEVNIIKEAMDAGLFKLAVTMYLQLLKPCASILWRINITVTSMTFTRLNISCSESLRTYRCVVTRTCPLSLFSEFNKLTSEHINALRKENLYREMKL